MLSTLELERLTDADVGRCLNDTTGLIGRVRMEARPILRVVVEFTVPVGAPGQEQELRAGIWPDRSLTEIRQNAERMRQSVRIQEPSLATTSAQALYQGRARTTVTIRPIPRPAAHAGLGPLFEGIAATDHRTPTRPFLRVVDVFERWVHEALAARKDRGESVRRSMLKDVLPELGELTANTVRRHQIVAVLERIVARGSARQAGCVLADLRQMFRWAAQAAMLDNDPTALMRKSDFGGAAQVRRRHLSTVELHELAAKMSEARLARHVRHGIWLMLATGVRIGELAMARWQDIDIQPQWSKTHRRFVRFCDAASATGRRAGSIAGMGLPWPLSERAAFAQSTREANSRSPTGHPDTRARERHHLSPACGGRLDTA
jgi:hypothetical protein